MRLGIWKDPASQFLLSGLPAEGADFEVALIDKGEALEAVRSGLVDVALTSTVSVITGPDDIEVVPAVAVSSWRNPFACVVLPASLGNPAEVVVFEPGDRQEALVAKIILKEHYQMEPVFTAVESLAEHGSSARLVAGTDVPTSSFDGLTLDLGQEWYELANYPMVWGVFVMRNGAVTPHVVEGLIRMADRAEMVRSQWVDSKDFSESLRKFFAEDVRVRFDDLAVASISELLDHAFYYDLVDEMRDFPIAQVDVEHEDDSDGMPLI